MKYWTVGLQIKTLKTKKSTCTTIKQKTIEFKVLTTGRDIITIIIHTLITIGSKESTISTLLCMFKMASLLS